MFLLCELYSFLEGRSRHLIMSNSIVSGMCVWFAMHRGKVTCTRLFFLKRMVMKGYTWGLEGMLETGGLLGNKAGSNITELPGNLFQGHRVGKLFSIYPSSRLKTVVSNKK